MPGKELKFLWRVVVPIFVAVIGGVVVAFIAQQGRFAPKSISLSERTPPPKQSATAAGGPTPPDRQSAVETRRTGLTLRVDSDPEGADIYLDWRFRGKTPVLLKRAQIAGLLVAVKEGRRAAFRRIHNGETGGVQFDLPSESTRPRARLLLVISEGAPGETFPSLRGTLVKEGFTILGPEEAREFQQELKRAGGLSHQGLRAWARARFETDLLVLAHFHHSSRQLSEQEFGYPGVGEAVKGAVRTKIGIEMEVVDLRSGDHLTAITGTGVGFALDRGRSFQKALTQAADESARLLRQRILG